MVARGLQWIAPPHHHSHTANPLSYHRQLGTETINGTFQKA